LNCQRFRDFCGDCRAPGGRHLFAIP
jgi:hypothetical protein